MRGWGLVESGEVHVFIEAGDLGGVAVEGESFADFAGTHAVFLGLVPGAGDIGVDVAVEAVGGRIGGAPRGGGLVLDEGDADDGLGVFEAAAVAALSLFGVEYEKAFAFAICAHMISLIFSSLVGLIGLTIDGGNISKIYQSLISRKK